MWHVFRSALLWLIAVALPLHGAAAATMIACGPTHHGAAIAASAQPAAAASHGHHDHGAAPHAEHGHGPHADGDHGIDAQAPDATPDAKDHQAGTCSVCASCCTAAALPASVIALDPHPIADDLQPGPQAHAAVFMTDGPERPPRIFLA